MTNDWFRISSSADNVREHIAHIAVPGFDRVIDDAQFKFVTGA